MNPITLNTAMSFGDRMSYGLQVFAVGLGTVFAVLAILWLALILFKVFLMIVFCMVESMDFMRFNDNFSICFFLLFV